MYQIVGWGLSFNARVVEYAGEQYLLEDIRPRYWLFKKVHHA